MQNIAANLAAVRARIESLCRRYGREPDAVTVLAVSKTLDADAVRAAAACGQHDFGENYVQEALAKMEPLRDLPLRWHFIGPIQSNKTRAIAARFQWVHSVDREKIARRLAEARTPAQGPLDICLQVNISGEATKSGADPADVPALADTVAALPGLRLRGLMALPAPDPDFAAQRAAFAQLRALFFTLRKRGLDLDTLSMGTSSDLEAAIAEGATIVRLGTAIFGPRRSPRRD
jgi:hypothetical protein